MMKELICTQAQDFHDLRIEALDRPLREGGDHMIERRAASLHAGGDIGGQRAIAVVTQP